MRSWSLRCKWGFIISFISAWVAAAAFTALPMHPAFNLWLISSKAHAGASITLVPRCYPGFIVTKSCRKYDFLHRSGVQTAPYAAWNAAFTLNLYITKLLFAACSRRSSSGFWIQNWKQKIDRWKLCIQPNDSCRVSARIPATVESHRLRRGGLKASWCAL